MATTEKPNTKVILLAIAVVVLLALAVWQGSRTLGGNPNEITFMPKNPTPPDGAPLSVHQGGGAPVPVESGDKTGAD
jgi:hypothetical protein